MKGNFKKVIALALSVSMLFTSMVTVNAATYGDVNKDGVITSSDAAMILQYVLDNEAVSLSQEQISLANVTGSGSITASDAAQVLSKVLDSDYRFPVDDAQPTTKETTTQTTTKETIETTTKVTTTQTTTKETPVETTTRDLNAKDVYVLDPKTVTDSSNGAKIGTDGFFTLNAAATVNTESKELNGVTYDKYLSWGSTNKGFDFTLTAPGRLVLYYSTGGAALKKNGESVSNFSGKDTLKTSSFDLTAGKYSIVTASNSKLRVYYAEVLTGDAYSDVATETTTLDVLVPEKDSNGVFWYKHSVKADDISTIKQGSQVGDSMFFEYTSNGNFDPTPATFNGVSYNQAFKFTQSGKGIAFSICGPTKIKVIAVGDVGVYANPSTSRNKKLTTLTGTGEVTELTYEFSGRGMHSLSGTIYAITVETTKDPNNYPTAPDLPNITTLPRYGEVIYPSQTIVVKAGETFDGQGVSVNPGKFAVGGQGEGGDPAIRLEAGATVKNVIIQYPSGDGIHCYGNGVGSGKFITIENCHWEDIGEDAMTVKAAGDVYMNGCSAAYAQDKCFQINAETNYTFRYVTVDTVGKFLRQNGGTNFPITVYLDHITASNVADQFMASNASGSKCYYKNLNVVGMDAVDIWHINHAEWTDDIKSPTDVLLGIQ